jgi:hypothetical protein
MVDVSIKADPRDVLEFQRIMGKLQTVLGKTPDKAVELGAVFVAKALQGATAVSPKKRMVKPASYLAVSNAPDKWVARVNRTRNTERWIPIPGHWATKEQAMQRPAARITYRGLARLLWWKAIGRLGAEASGGSAPQVGSKTGQKADKLISVTLVRGSEASARITDNARYALQAIKGSGKSTIDNVMRRAANSMRKYVERQSGLKFTEGNL